MVSAFIHFKENSYGQCLLRKLMRMSGEKRESVFIGKFTFAILPEENREHLMALEVVVFTDIGRKFLLAVLPEENHENLSALKEGSLHSYFMEVYIGNSLKKITDSQGLSEKLCSLASKESYIVIFHEEYHESLRILHGICVHWHLKKIPIVNCF
jgi:hypothetical protein